MALLFTNSFPELALEESFIGNRDKLVENVQLQQDNESERGQSQKK